MKKIFFFSLVAFLLASCAQEEIQMPEVSGGEATTVRSLEDALKIADSFLLSLDDNTRAGSRTVESVEYLGGNAATRSEDGAEKPMYYVVNYADDQGFAILSADKRLTPVYAISPEGSVNLADTVINPAFREFIKSLPKDETGIRRIVNPGDVTTTIKIDEVVKPLLRVEVRKWDQTMFNDSVRYHNGGYADTKVGRMPLATAQIFAHFMYPSSIKIIKNGKETYYPFHWKDIFTGEARSELCKLFDILGSKAFYDCDYDYDETTCQGNKYYKRVLTKFNYGFMPMDEENEDNFRIPFDITIASNQLKFEKDPIIMDAEYKEIEDGYSIYNNYYWVIDGYATSQSFSTYEDPIPHTLYYYHMVWGNGQSCDGYYYVEFGNSFFRPSSAGFASDDLKDGSFGIPMNKYYMYYGYSPMITVGV